MYLLYHGMPKENVQLNEEMDIDYRGIDRDR